MIRVVAISEQGIYKHQFANQAEVNKLITWYSEVFNSDSMLHLRQLIIRVTEEK